MTTNLTQSIGLSKFLEGKMPIGIKYSKKSLYDAIGVNPKRFEAILKDTSIITLKEAEAIATYFNVNVSEVFNLKDK
jgi:DNA-binding XRE family transcriptional regulator